jgi:hypothetical protein
MGINIFGEQLIVNVNVISINPKFVPSGMVILREGYNTLAVKHLENGAAQFILPPYTLQPGVHKLVVYHAGDKHFAPSTSPIFVKEVITK